MATVRFWCAVPGCLSKYKKHKTKSENTENTEENDIKFHRFPAPESLKVTYMQNLARDRLAKWMNAIPELRTASKRICSKHFLTGFPAALTNINDVDWVPTVNLWAAVGNTVVQQNKPFSELKPTSDVIHSRNRVPLQNLDLVSNESVRRQLSLQENVSVSNTVANCIEKSSQEIISPESGIFYPHTTNKTPVRSAVRVRSVALFRSEFVHSAVVTDDLLDSTVPDTTGSDILDATFPTSVRFRNDLRGVTHVWNKPSVQCQVAIQNAAAKGSHVPVQTPPVYGFEDVRSPASKAIVRRYDKTTTETPIRSTVPVRNIVRSVHPAAVPVVPYDLADHAVVDSSGRDILGAQTGATFFNVLPCRNDVFSKNKPIPQDEAKDGDVTLVSCEPSIQYKGFVPNATTNRCDVRDLRTTPRIDVSVSQSAATDAAVIRQRESATQSELSVGKVASIRDEKEASTENITPVRSAVPIRSINLFHRATATHDQIIFPARSVTITNHDKAAKKNQQPTPVGAPVSAPRKSARNEVAVQKDDLNEGSQHRFSSKEFQSSQGRNIANGNNIVRSSPQELSTSCTQYVQATPKIRCHSTQTKLDDVELLKRNAEASTAEIEQLKRAASTRDQEVESLRKRIRRTKVDLQTLQDRPGDCKFYTGVGDCRIVNMLFTLIRPYILTPLNLTKEQVFLMTLQKLRFNFFYKSLSISYEVCPATISKYFFSTIYTIFHVMHNVVYWPDRSVLKKHTPKCFRDVFGESVSVIIDCFEIRGEKPSNPIAAAQQWSDYKKSNTLKYLIGISSAGSVIFVSKGYGGRASDKTIATSSGFLDNIAEGDTILADRGFLIEEAVRAKKANLNMPAFRKNGGQLSAVDIENTRKIANVRIHVERVIGQIREKYQLLKKSVPMTLMMKKHNNVMAMDMIVFVAAILVNLCKPIVN